MTDLNMLPDLDSWLGQHGQEIAELIEFSKCHLDPNLAQLNEISADLNAKAAQAGYLLADCESHLIFSKAQAARVMPDNLGPTAQKIFVEERTRELRRLRDQLKVLVRSLRNLSINVCSIRKTSHVP